MPNLMHALWKKTPKKLQYKLSVRDIVLPQTEKIEKHETEKSPHESFVLSRD